MRKSHLKSNSFGQLKLYQNAIYLDAAFSRPTPDESDAKSLLRKAISSLWSPKVERSLAIHLPSFFDHIAKDVATLWQLLQLASQTCEIDILTSEVLKLIDLTYASVGTAEHDDYDCQKPAEAHQLAHGEYLLIFDDHANLSADATVTFCTDAFAVPHDDYRSYRINALAGPRARRDCSVVRRSLSESPRAIVTRGYFSTFRLIIHCQRPYADSELAMHQRLQIRDTYLDVLELAHHCNVATISMPLICPRGSFSTVNKAYRTALEAVTTARAMGWRFRTVSITGASEAHKPASPKPLLSAPSRLPTFP